MNKLLTVARAVLKAPGRSLLGKARRPNAALMAFVSALSATTWAATSSFSVGNGATTVLNAAASSISFPVTRSGDTDYDVYVDYATQNGSALAGTDYTASSGHQLLAAGSTTGSISVPVTGHTGTADKNFALNLLRATGVGPTPNFAAERSFATGTNPISVATADLNGDGRPDLLAPNLSDNSVSVLLNATAAGAATPSFAVQQSFATGLRPLSVSAADINGDGKPDLLVANATARTVSVLRNTTAPGAANPSFAAQQSFSTGAGANFVSAADVNGDGRPDLLVATAQGNSVAVLLNTTAPGAVTPSFAPQQGFATGAFAFAVSAADVNGDGRPDLLAANSNSDNVSVLLNTTAPGTTTPSFAAQQAFATGSGSGSVSAADFNGDGRPDLLVANSNSDNVSVLINTTAPGATTPSFAAQQSIATGAGPFSIIADINSDGRPDLLVTNQGSAAISVLVNTTAPGAATPSFAALQNFATGFSPFSISAADFNGDGKPDLVVPAFNRNSVSVLLNTTAAPTAAAPSFANLTSFRAGTNPLQVNTADINGDGRPDLLTANSDDQNVSVLLNTTAPGATTPSYAAQQTFIVGQVPRSVSAADINGDGRPDVLVANSNAASISVLLNTTAPGAATPSLAAQQTFTTGGGTFFVATADVNGDGRRDLLLVNNADATVSVLLNTTAPGATTLSFAAQRVFATGVSPFALSTADINGDGRPDLAVANYSSSSVSVLLNTTAPGATTPSFAAELRFATGPNPFSISSADVNGDGRPDLMTTNVGSNSASVLLNTTAPGASTPSFAAQQGFTTGTNPYSISAADVNGDGRPDLLVSHYGDGTFSVLLNTTAPGATTASFVTQRAIGAGSTPISIATADVNGDGSPDVITANFDFGNVSVLLNSLYRSDVSTVLGTGTIHYRQTSQLSAAPNPLNFGSQVASSQSTVQTVTVSNSGLAAATFSGFSITGTNATDFSQTNSCGSSLAAGSSCAVSLRFTPGAVGSRSASLRIASDDPSSPLLVSLTGTGVARNPAFTASPNPLDFGNHAVGSTSTARAITLTNTGNVDLSSIGSSASGSNPTEFAVSSNACAGSLAPAATCTISFTFTPTAAGSRSATETFTATDAVTSVQKTASSLLTGTGRVPAVSFSPASLAFGTQRTGTHSAVMTSTLTNSGNSALTISAISATGDYGQSNDCPASLAVSATCTISVTFTPTALGSRTGTVTVLSNAPTSPDTLPLSGTGTAPTATLSPSSLAFGNQRTGTSSAAKSSTLSNDGSSPLTITSIAASGDYSQTNDCPATLAAGASCAVNVTFRPTTTGSRNGSVTVSSDAAGSPGSVTLTGTGTAPAAILSPTTLAFGDQTVGTSSAARTSTLSNTGSSPLMIFSIATSGDYSQSNDCPASLGVSATCTISVIFTPSSTGGRAGAVMVNSDAADSPGTITLSGNGSAPAVATVSLNPTSLGFGNQRTGTHSAVQTSTLTNTGNSALTIGAISATGDYQQGNDCPNPLAAGASCTISVTFSPTADGSQTGTVTVMSNGVGGDSQIALTGTGVTPAIALSPGSLSFADQTTGTSSAVMTSTLSNPGSDALAIGSIVASGDYSQGNDCPASLPAGGSCTIRVTFSPTANGSRMGSISISHDANGSPSSISLSGNGAGMGSAPVDTRVGSTSYDSTPSPEGLGGTYRITAQFCNNTSRGITDFTHRVNTLTNNNNLISRTSNAPTGRAGGPGALQRVNPSGQYSDGTLSPGECVNETSVVGLTSKSRFTFTIDLLGNQVP